MKMLEDTRRALVEWFNNAAPIGTPVRYWPGVREGEGTLSTTRTEAQILDSGSPVVWVAGRGDCIALTHVELVTKLPPLRFELAGYITGVDLDDGVAMRVTEDGDPDLSELEAFVNLSLPSLRAIAGCFDGSVRITIEAAPPEDDE